MKSSNLHCAALRQTVFDCSPSLEKSTFEPKKGLSPQAFMCQCDVKVESVHSHTDHIVKNRTALLKNWISDADEPEPKCGGEKTTNGAFAPGFHP